MAALAQLLAWGPGLLVSDSASYDVWKESGGADLRLIRIARRLLDARTTRLFWAELDSERDRTPDIGASYGLRDRKICTEDFNLS